MKRFVLSCVWLAVVAGVSAVPGRAGVTYTCAGNVDTTQAGTCAYLNATIAGLYNSTFTNANANIYIQFGTTGLGQSQGFQNFVSYSTYVSDLSAEATATGNAIETSAVSVLEGSTEETTYGSGDVELTAALGEALGVSSLTGITSTGRACALGTAGCYDGIITITTPANLSSETGGTQGLYWRQAGGSIPSNDYDYYSVVEHETDEVLGTSSCIETGGSTLADGCGGTTPSAVDLYRYYAGSLVTTGSAVGQTALPAGAYFSYNGGSTNGADGAVYNTLSNGEDYADFTNSCQFVQDMNGCTGTLFDITTDGGPEINILDAVGYATQSPVPEPATIALLGGGLAMFAVYRRRKRG